MAMFSRRSIKFFKNIFFLLVFISLVYLLSNVFASNRKKSKSHPDYEEQSYVREFIQSDLAPPVRIPSESQQKTRLNYKAHIFYYAWYGAPDSDGQWFHWNHKYLENWDKTDKKTYPTGFHTPPEDIGANFFPKLGPYSSRNESVINQHFKWIAEANVGVVAVSWYPPGMTDENGPQSDRMIPALLDAAQNFNIKICLHIEPYQNRTAENFRRNLKYVHDTYSSHPAYYTVRRGNRNLPLFYVYDSYQVPSSEWNRLFSRKGDLTVRDTELDGLFIALLVDLKHRYEIKRAMFDGFYTYFASNGFSYGSTWKHWRNLADYAMKTSLIFIPSVGPGYLDTRVRPWNSKNTRDRRNGIYYETAWRTALQTSPRFISITSFNEWHEGTQIEPAIPYRHGQYTYQSYDPQEPNFYLRITKNFTLYPSFNT